MSDLGWLADVFALTVLAAAAYSLGRVIAAPLRGRRVHYDVDITHALMGACMAGMFVADLRFLSAGMWRATFAVVIAWYVIRAIAGSRNRNSSRRGLLNQTGHLLSVAAMLYMLQAVPPAAAEAMYAPSMPMEMALPAVREGVRPQALSLLIAALLVGYAVLAANQVRRVVRTQAPAGSDGLPLAPRAAVACEMVMCVAMAVMLVARL